MELQYHYAHDRGRPWGVPQGTLSSHEYYRRELAKKYRNLAEWKQQHSHPNVRLGYEMNRYMHAVNSRDAIWRTKLSHGPYFNSPTTGGLASDNSPFSDKEDPSLANKQNKLSNFNPNVQVQYARQTRPSDVHKSVYARAEIRAQQCVSTVREQSHTSFRGYCEPHHMLHPNVNNIVAGHPEKSSNEVRQRMRDAFLERWHMGGIADERLLRQRLQKLECKCCTDRESRIRENCGALPPPPPLLRVATPARMLPRPGTVCPSHNVTPLEPIRERGVCRRNARALSAPSEHPMYHSMDHSLDSVTQRQSATRHFSLNADINHARQSLNWNETAKDENANADSVTRPQSATRHVSLNADINHARQSINWNETGEDQNAHSDSVTRPQSAARHFSVNADTNHARQSISWSETEDENAHAHNADLYHRRHSHPELPSTKIQRRMSYASTYEEENSNQIPKMSSSRTLKSSPPCLAKPTPPSPPLLAKQAPSSPPLLVKANTSVNINPNMMQRSSRARENLPNPPPLKRAPENIQATNMDRAEELRERRGVKRSRSDSEWRTGVKSNREGPRRTKSEESSSPSIRNMDPPVVGRTECGGTEDSEWQTAVTLNRGEGLEKANSEGSSSPRIRNTDPPDAGRATDGGMEDGEWKTAVTFNRGEGLEKANSEGSSSPSIRNMDPPDAGRTTDGGMEDGEWKTEVTSNIHEGLLRINSEGSSSPCIRDMDSPVVRRTKDGGIEKGHAKSCGGYAYDHKSLPIIVAVHSMVMEEESGCGNTNEDSQKVWAKLLGERLSSSPSPSTSLPDSSAATSTSLTSSPTSLASSTTTSLLPLPTSLPSPAASSSAATTTYLPESPIPHPSSPSPTTTYILPSSSSPPISPSSSSTTTYILPSPLSSSPLPSPSSTDIIPSSLAALPAADATYLHQPPAPPSSSTTAVTATYILTPHPSPPPQSSSSSSSLAAAEVSYLQEPSIPPSSSSTTTTLPPHSSSQLLSTPPPQSSEAAAPPLQHSPPSSSASSSTSEAVPLRRINNRKHAIQQDKVLVHDKTKVLLQGTRIHVINTTTKLKKYLESTAVLQSRRQPHVTPQIKTKQATSGIHLKVLNAPSPGSPSSVEKAPKAEKEQKSLKSCPKSPTIKKHQSVDDWSQKVLQTREKIINEEIDWKKKLLYRLEGLQVKRLKRAEIESGERTEIDLDWQLKQGDKEKEKKPEKKSDGKADKEKESVQSAKKAKAEDSTGNQKEKVKKKTRKCKDNTTKKDTGKQQNGNGKMDQLPQEMENDEQTSGKGQNASLADTITEEMMAKEGNETHEEITITVQDRGTQSMVFDDVYKNDIAIPQGRFKPSENPVKRNIPCEATTTDSKKKRYENHRVHRKESENVMLDVNKNGMGKSAVEILKSGKTNGEKAGSIQEQVHMSAKHAGIFSMWDSMRQSSVATKSKGQKPESKSYAQLTSGVNTRPGSNIIVKSNAAYQTTKDDHPNFSSVKIKQEKDSSLAHEVHLVFE